MIVLDKNHNRAKQKVNASLRDRTLIGVALGIDAVRLVKMQESDGRRRLVAWRTDTFVSGMTPDSRVYQDFIRKSLRSFCEGGKNVHLYLALQNVEVVVRNLLVPEVPARMLNDAVYWSLKKDVEFDEATHLFDYEITTQEEEDEQAAGEKRIPVMAYVTAKAPVMRIRQLFESIGFPVEGITFPFFAVRNLFSSGWIDSAGHPAAFFYIGNDASRITVYQGALMPSSRSIKLGVDSLAAAIQENAGRRLTAEEARRVLFSLGFDNTPLSKHETGYGLEPDAVMEMLGPTLRRMTRQLERTLHYCSSQLGINRVDEIYVSGELASCEMAIFELREQVKGDLFLINPFEGGGQDMTSDAPVSISERALFASAVGAAMWDAGRTPDLLNTCRDKERRHKTEQTNRFILVGFAALALILGGVLGWQYHLLGKASREQAELTHKLHAAGPRLTEADVQRMAARLVAKSSSLRDYGRRFQAVAVLGELSRRTPEWALLMRLDVQFSRPVGRVGHTAGGGPPPGSLQLDGVVVGDVATLTSRLTEYMIALESSPFFHDVLSLDTTIADTATGETGLHFRLMARLDRVLTGGGRE